MPSRYVANLMSEDSGQLRLVVHVCQDAAREIYESTRYCKCIHHMAIEYCESPGQIGTMGYFGQLHTDAAEVFLQRRVFNYSKFAQDLRVRSLTNGNLLAFADQGELAAACNRIFDAGYDEKKGQQQPWNADTFHNHPVQRHAVEIAAAFSKSELPEPCNSSVRLIVSTEED
jgi:hypothetical protein